MENLNREANQNQSGDFWQAEVLGQVYDTNFAAITGWISEGAIQPSDKVRRGNLRWINAGKVPAFIPFFNARENGIRLNDVKINHIQFSDNERKINSTDQKNCFIHEQEKSAFKCEICGNTYCQNCFADEQNKDCPICGAYCRSLNLLDTDLNLSDQSTETKKFDSANSETENAQNFDSTIRLPSDVLKTKTKGLSIFFIIFVGLAVSGLGSYLWAYEYNLESESALQSLPEVAALDTKFKTDLEQAMKNAERGNAEKARKAELKKVNENQYVKVRIGQSTDSTKDVNEIDDQSGINNFPHAENVIKESHSRERAKIIGDYQNSRSKRNFIEVFVGLFFIAFAGLFTVRYFTNK